MTNTTAVKPEAVSTDAAMIVADKPVVAGETPKETEAPAPQATPKA